MPELEAALKKVSERSRHDHLADLKSIFSFWTIQARYSPVMTNMKEAELLLERVRRLKELLK
jgi:hypothetical protein